MKDGLSAVRQFTSEGNLSKNGNLNTTTMREMWDYENQEPITSKTKGASEVISEKPKNIQSISKIECKLCGGNHEDDQCPHESRFSQLGVDATRPNTRNRFLKGKSRSIDYSKPQQRQPSLWKPAQSVNGKMSPVEPQSIKHKLTSENLSELGPGKYQLEMGCRQVLLDQTTKAWVDEQNKINKEERPRYGRLYNKGEDLMYPDPQLDAESPIKSQKGGTAATLEKDKDAPQPSHALQEFVKHITYPLVDKGWNLHLKFGKGEFQKEQFVQGSTPWKPTDKTNKIRKISKPQIDKQIPLEMGTGGGGGGKKGGSGGRKPLEDKVEMENYPNENKEDDSSSETSLKLDVNPQQLASVGLNRPLLRLRLTPRRRLATAAPGWGVGCHHHWEEKPKLYHCVKDKMVESTTNLLRVVGIHHNHQMVGVEELAHHSWKGVEECLSDWWVEEELLHLVVMEVVMRMVMTMEGVIDHLPKE